MNISLIIKDLDKSYDESNSKEKNGTSHCDCHCSCETCYEIAILFLDKKMDELNKIKNESYQICDTMIRFMKDMRYCLINNTLFSGDKKDSDEIRQDQLHASGYFDLYSETFKPIQNIRSISYDIFEDIKYYRSQLDNDNNESIINFAYNLQNYFNDIYDELDELKCIEKEFRNVINYEDYDKDILSKEDLLYLTNFTPEYNDSFKSGNIVNSV